MTQIFRIAFLAALGLVNCRSASVTRQGVFASRATLPLLLSLVPAAFSIEEVAGDVNSVGDLSDEGGVESDDAEEIMPADIMKDMDKDGDGFMSLAEMARAGEDMDAKEKEEVLPKL